jgi:hypothetical protein
MTPYRERRAKGQYNPKGEKTQSTTTDNLAGLGAPQQAKPKKPSARKKRSN